MKPINIVASPAILMLSPLSPSESAVELLDYAWILARFERYQRWRRRLGEDDGVGDVPEVPSPAIFNDGCHISALPYIGAGPGRWPSPDGTGRLPPGRLGSVIYSDGVRCDTSAEVIHAASQVGESRRAKVKKFFGKYATQSNEISTYALTYHKENKLHGKCSNRISHARLICK